jgi:hypothetical protein
MLLEILLLAVGSMFWPVLLAVDVVALRSDRRLSVRLSIHAQPVRLLVG